MVCCKGSALLTCRGGRRAGRCRTCMSADEVLSGTGIMTTVFSADSLAPNVLLMRSVICAEAFRFEPAAGNREAHQTVHYPPLLRTCGSA